MVEIAPKMLFNSGWANSIEFIREGKVTTDASLCEAEQAEYDQVEADLCDRVGSKGSKLPYRLVWIEVERLRTEYQWRPVRDFNATVSDNELFALLSFQNILQSK